MSALPLPASLQVFERGWLSANNYLFTGPDGPTLVDTGYLSHAAQTLALVRHALGEQALRRVVNTHTHSDHIGGNAALHATYGCRISLPAGLAPAIERWDEEALLLTPLGQQAAPFPISDTLAAGDLLPLGEDLWQCLAVPGHDMDALAFYQPERRLLISGDALWENGFGVLFPELLAQADGIAGARHTLEALARLPIDLVLPGHGRPFADVDGALNRAFGRLQRYAEDAEHLAWHALKVCLVFLLLDKRRLTVDEAESLLLALPFVTRLNEDYLRLSPDRLCSRLLGDLTASGALHLADGVLSAP